MQIRMRFKDLRAGGRALAPMLDRYRGQDDALVLGLVRGGVPASIEVARHLHLPVDVAIQQRLLLPHGPDGPPVAVVSAAGVSVIPEGVMTRAAAPSEPLDFFFAEALTRFSSNEVHCRGNRTPLTLTGRTILLVDNGIRTGRTVSIVVAALRTLSVTRIIVAVPVASSLLQGLDFGADLVECAAWVHPFANVGIAYEQLDVPQFEEIGAMIERETRPSVVHG